jgi:isoamylase
MAAQVLGARFAPDGASVVFRVFAPDAVRIELWTYTQPTNQAPVARQVMTGSVSGVFELSVATTDLRQSDADTVYYGYRAWGPNWAYDPTWQPGQAAGFAADVDRDGNRFNPNKLLLDPYALEVSHCVQTPAHPDGTDYQSGATSRLVDTGPFAPKGILLTGSMGDFGSKPQRAFKDDIIYEVHLRGLTKADPTVPVAIQGTYAGAAQRAAYLRDLGVTAVEFLPIHQTQNALNDLPQYAADHNYWGYSTMNYFAPDRRFAADQSPGGPTREWLAMVKAFHDVGLKVFVDVVYNHHNEDDVDAATGTIGTIYSLRGLDNTGYYEDTGEEGQPNLYQNDNGVGPNLNAATSSVRDLVTASLQYWTDVLGADGFRFDLAAVLGNARPEGGYLFDVSDPDNILNRAVRILPARPAAGGPGVDLIAEPYTADGNGQEQGQFPVGWAEWNDRFRDTLRASQNKLGIIPVTPGMLATRFAGSDDLFRPNGRQPWNSVNYVVCHDGFTLQDLHSYLETRNAQPFPFGPSPGGRSAAQEMCWNHGGDAVPQAQAVRTSLALLLLSAGVPMLSGGSEMGRTQYGNNNAFNLDTVANWFDWSLATTNADLVTFTCTLLHFRLDHAALRPAGFFTGALQPASSIKDLTWLQSNGSEIDGTYFADPDNHFIAYQIDGTAAGDPAARIYIAYNGWTDPITVVLPALSQPQAWFQVMDTATEAQSWGYIHPPGAETRITGANFTIQDHSCIVMIAR